MATWADFDGNGMIDYGEFMLMNIQWNWFFIQSEGESTLTSE